MLLSVEHRTTYTYAERQNFTSQLLKLTPRDDSQQRILDWTVKTDIGSVGAPVNDGFGNPSSILTVAKAHSQLTVTVNGQVETMDNAGLVQGTYEPLHPRVFLRETELTASDVAIAALADGMTDRPTIESLHNLSARVREVVDYVEGETDATTTAIDALKSGKGVCQDHAHLFISACRTAGVPARYVSGYMWIIAETDEPFEANHAWAEAFNPDLGWIGFDVANQVSPTDAYLRVATGLDYLNAAPVRGIRRGEGAESLDVDVLVRQIGGEQ